MLKTIRSREPQAAETRGDSSRRAVLSYRSILDQLAKSVPSAEAWVVTSLPRGSLQVVQPPKVSESLLKAYSREFHADDRPVWQAIVQDRALRGNEAWAGDAFEQSSFYKGLMEPAGLRYVAAAPLMSPVLNGYAGALEVFRNTEQGDFSSDDLREIVKAAHHIDEMTSKTRTSRLSPTCARQQAWLHRPSIHQFAFDAKGQLLVSEKEFAELDERLREQIARDARHRLHQMNGSLVSSDRLAFPDSRGDLWVFRAITHRQYSALSDGPVIFYCLQPDFCDWSVVRPVDFQADPELSRLVPAMEFMQEQYSRGPTLHEIAKTVHLSPFHFHRRFTELLGVTPKHFLLECQIYEAKLQLAAREKELVEIASSCGFAHQSHFTSRFKQATGLTPTRWRKLAIKMQIVGKA